MKKKVLFSSHSAELVGGAEKSLMDLVKYLNENDFDCLVTLPGEGSFSKALQKIGVAFTTIYSPPWIHAPGDISDYAFNNKGNNTITALGRLIESYRPDICVTNTIAIPWLAYASALKNTPHCWIVRESFQADDGIEYYTSYSQVIKTIGILSEKVYFNSKYTRGIYTQATTLPSTGIIYPHVSVRKHLLPGKKPRVFPKDALKLCIVGQINPSKRQEDALTALSLLKQTEPQLNTHLAIVGAPMSDKEMARIDNLAIELGVKDAVTFTGFSDDAAAIMRSCDIVLNCATNEAFGRTTVEAMLLEKPVVGARAAGTKEIITDHVTGLLYTPADPHDLTDKIKLLANDQKLANDISKQAKREASMVYSRDACYRDFVDYLNSDNHITPLDLSPMWTIAEDA